MESHRQDSPMPDRPPENETVPAGAQPSQLAVATNSEDVSDDSLSTGSSSADETSGNHPITAGGQNNNTNSSSNSHGSSSSSAAGSSSISSATSTESNINSAPRPARGWFPIHQDASRADAAEIAGIVAAGESNALDESYWSNKFLKPLDPEYAVTGQGRIDWIISPFNGTSAEPQTHHVYTSSPVHIGGYAWRLKVFPKGLEGPYLAASLECKPQDHSSKSGSSQINFSTNNAAGERHEEQGQIQRTSKPWKIPAQFEIVVYNPDEPRVHFSKGSSQAFSNTYATCSFKRFAPYNVADIGIRMPGQRQALLQNDKLGVVVYIRTFRDETGCLFLRPSDSHLSFSITGLRGVTPTRFNDGPHKGFVAAVISWAFLPPVRRIVSQLHNAVKQSVQGNAHQARLACAMHFFYNYIGWSAPEPASNASLSNIEKAISWHGFALPTTVDLFEVFEVFKKILVREAEALQLDNVRAEIESAGSSRINIARTQNRRTDDVQAFVSSYLQESDGLNDDISGILLQKPVVLLMQIPRHRLNREKVEWKRSKRQYGLNEKLTVGGLTYILCAIVAHDHGNVHSKPFSTIVRADGINWYKYGADYRRVVRLTRRQTFVDTLESSYAAIYVREDANEQRFLKSEFESNPLAPSTNNGGPVTPATESKPDSVKGCTFIELRHFLGGQHPGFVDLYHLKGPWSFDATLDSNSNLQDLVRNKWSRLLHPNEKKLKTLIELDQSISRFYPGVQKRDQTSDQKASWPVYLFHMVDEKGCDKTMDKCSNSRQSSKCKIQDKNMSQDTAKSVPTNSTMPTGAVKVEDVEMTDSAEKEIGYNLQGNNEQLVFVKLFDPKEQVIIGVSCFMAGRKDQVSAKVTEHLGSELSELGPYHLFGEFRPGFGKEATDMSKQLRDSSTFEIEFEEHECIVIVSPNLSQKDKDDILQNGGIVDVNTFIRYLYAREYDPVLTRPNLQTNVTRDYYGSTSFKGTLSRGHPHGHGTEITLGGEVYKGDFRMGLRHGKGLLTLPSGTTYQGDFAEGEPHGIGKQVDLKTGNTYTGGFQRGKKRGRGTTEWQQAEEEVKVCRVCYDKEQDCAFYPCGHVCACYECAKAAKTCPMCHREGSRAFKLYFAC